MRPAALGQAAGWLPSPAVLLVGLTSFAICLALRHQLLGDGDTFLHVAAGQWLLEHRAIPHSDPFSGGLPGARWVAHEWLAEIILALAHKAGDIQGLVLISAAAFALMQMLMLHSLLRYLPPPHALLFCVVAGALFAVHLLARPHLLAMPFAMLWSMALIEARQQGRVPSLWWVLLMGLWANLHGSFPLGLGFAGLMAVEAGLEAEAERRWRALLSWAGFVLLATLATLVTPHGLDGMAFPFMLSGMSTVTDLIEWQSPDFRAYPILEGTLIGLVGVPLALGLRLPPVRLVLLLGLLHLALTSLRHVELLGIFGPLFAAPALGPQIARLRAALASADDGLVGPVWRPSGWPLLGAVLLLASMMAGAFMGSPMPLTNADSRPIAAIEVARARGLNGPVLNAYNFGSYMIFAGLHPYIDGRMDMYGPDYYSAYRDAIQRPDTHLAALLDQRAIAWTLLAAGTAAAREMDRLPNWQRIHADEVAVIHVRTGDPR